MKVDEIEAKLDVLIDMYKADRQPTGTTPSDDAANNSTSKLLHRSLHSAGRPDDPSHAVNAQSVQRCSRSSRPMLRNLSDLGPRVTPSVSVMLSSPVSPTSSHLDRTAAGGGRHSPADTPPTSPPTSRRHPSTIHESTDETDRQNSQDDSTGDVIKQLPLSVTDDAVTRANLVALVDHVNSSSSTIGRTDSPAEDSSHTVIELTSLLES